MVVENERRFYNGLIEEAEESSNALCIIVTGGIDDNGKRQQTPCQQ